MRRHITIILLVLALLPTAALAQQTEREKEQQFKYYWYAARNAQDKGQYDLALTLYQFCEMINPQDAKTKETIGLIYYQAQQYDKSERYLREAFEASPGYCWRAYYTYMCYKWREDNTKTPNKLIILERAAQDNTKDAKLWEELASEYLGVADWEHSFASMDSMEAITGQQARCAMTRARIYIYQKKNKQALQTLNDYLNVNADDESALSLKMDLEQVVKTSWEEQKRTFERILALNPDNALALNNYAYYLSLRNEQLDKAEQMAFRAVTLDGENPSVLDTYAWILYKQGKKTAARLYIQRAVNLTPEYMKKTHKEVLKHYNIINR